MGIVIFYLLLCVIVAAIGADREIGFWGVFLWSLLLSPLVGIIVCMVAKSRRQGDMERQMAANIQTQTTLATQALQNSNKPNQQSVSDELAKLKKLKDEGVLNEEEYTKMKNKLIATFD